MMFIMPRPLVPLMLARFLVRISLLIVMAAAIRAGPNLLRGGLFSVNLAAANGTAVTTFLT